MHLPQVSAAISQDGVVLGSIFIENRLCADIGCVCAELVAAVLSAEDKRFYGHRGVDWSAIARAMWKNLRAGRVVQGGSTITQQLIKNVVLHDARRTLSRKFLETCLAMILERKLSKRQILQAYLNAAYFGHGIYGVRLAALYYLSKEVDELSVEDSAYLAGLLKGPRHFCRCCNADRSVMRTGYVLRRMVQNGYTTRSGQSNQSGRRFKGRKTIASACPATTPYYLDFVRQWLFRCCPGHFPSHPLIVKTSLNLGCQEILEKVCRDAQQNGFRGRLACIVQDANTGLVRALSGGYDFQSQPFNVAINGSIQPGSTFKPFVLAAALKAGISSEKRYTSQPLEIQLSNHQIWRVGNFQKVYRGEITLAEALIFSDNSVFAQLMLDIGVDSVSRLLRILGFDACPLSPAAAIGAVTKGVSPLQVCSSYSMFSAEGLFLSSSPVLRVQNELGDVLLNHVTTFHPVLSPGTAKTINKILRQVVTRGTGSLSAHAEGIQAKTGTTREGSWYASFDPAFRVLTWVEHTDDDRALNYSEKGVTARNLAQRIWDLLRRGSYGSTQLYGVFRGVNNLTVRDLLWVEEQFA